MFSRKFLKGSSVAVVGASLASGLQCQVTSADAYLEAKNEFGEKFYLPVNKEQAKEMLKGFCEAGLLNKGDLEEANKILDSEQGFSFVRFLLFLIWLDLLQASISVMLAHFIDEEVVNQDITKARYFYKNNSVFIQNLVAHCYSFGRYSFLIRGLKFLLGKGKDFLGSSKSPVILYMLVTVKNENVEFIN